MRSDLYKYPLRPEFENIPIELKERACWVTWDEAKKPFDPRMTNGLANVNDPETWGAFEVARTAYEEGGREGVGIVLDGDGLVGVDLDDCVENGKPNPQAIILLDRIGCKYIEFSPSGTGLRGFGFSKEPPKRCKGVIDGIKVELYSEKRYLTVTGHVWRVGAIVFLPGFVSMSAELRPTEENRRARKITEDHTGHLLYSSVGVPHHTIPTEEGQRNKALFELARHLRGEIPNASLYELRPIVQEWHRLALPVIGTKDFGITWADFSRGWEKVQFPTGVVLDNALQGFERDSLPEGVQVLGYGEYGNALIKICLRLARYHEPEPFFISARQAGELLKMHFTEAAKLLSALLKDGVIDLVEKGAGKRASRYRWAFS